MKTRIELGKIDYERTGKKDCMVVLYIEINTKQPSTAPFLDIDLKPITGETTRLSISGSVLTPNGRSTHAGGQIIDTVRQYFRSSRVRRLCDIWEKYHLNDMKAGTREQSAALKSFTTDDRLNYYQRQCDFLKQAGLLDVPIPEESRANFAYKPVAGDELPITYRFGAAWLYEAIPNDVLLEVQNLIAQFQNERSA